MPTNLVASMTSSSIITPMASMTSTASLASKKLLALYILSDFPGIGKLNSLNGLLSLKKLLRLIFSSTLAPK